jgi:hypothetical protein
MAFQKGKSGNPGGRPKRGVSLTEILDNLGAEKIGTGEDAMERKQALAKMLWSKAIDDHDIVAAKYIFDRIDGTPIARNEISGPDGESLTAIQIEFIGAVENKD